MTPDQVRDRLLALPPEELDAVLLKGTAFHAFAYADSAAAEAAFHRCLELSDRGDIRQISLNRGLLGGRNIVFALGEDAGQAGLFADELAQTAVEKIDAPRTVKLQLARRRLGLVLDSHDRGESRLSQRAHYGEKGRTLR